MTDLYSPRRVMRVNRQDGRTRITHVQRGHHWERAEPGLRLTPETAQRLRGQRIQGVELRRWGRRARAPIAWLGSASADRR
jgi:hypothetical protein